MQPECRLPEGGATGHGRGAGEEDVVGEEDGEAVAEPRLVGHDPAGETGSRDGVVEEGRCGAVIGWVAGVGVKISGTGEVKSQEGPVDESQ